jgi:Xaa-Pro dipeptidase
MLPTSLGAKTMSAVSRRDLLQLTGAAALGAASSAESAAADVPAPIAALLPMTEGVAPITLGERQGRLGRARKLMVEAGLDAVVMAGGTSLEYFTGARWRNSERLFGLVLTREGEPAWVTPAFEKRRALEQISLGTDVRAWEEHESPYALVASILKDRGVQAGRIGVEETVPFTFAHEIGLAAPAARLASATPVTAGCRMIKDAHEIDLMRRACEITVRAHRAVFASLVPGMAQSEAAALCREAHRRLGVEGGALVLFGADAAFPHGTTEPRPLQAGDVVLIDGGGKLHGYESDITRTMVFGAVPTLRQRTIWNVVRRAQEAAFKAMRPGVECQDVDRAARAVIEEAGFGRDYERFTHRVGHGIGMDGHEWTYLVRGNKTPLRPGMCFSDEPGIYIPGEIGVRHEDIVAVTETGCENLAPKWSGTPEEPAVI